MNPLCPMTIVFVDVALQCTRVAASVFHFARVGATVSKVQSNIHVHVRVIANVIAEYDTLICPSVTCISRTHFPQVAHNPLV
jgi:hypothetical protein